MCSKIGICTMEYIMLSFGAAFYTVKQESGYTHVNGKRESVIREIEVPVTIEIVDKQNPFYGCVKQT